MAGSKKAKTTTSVALDSDASPYSGVIAEVDELMGIIRNSEADSGEVKHAVLCLRQLMASTRFKISLSNHQIRTGISGRLPF